MIISENLARKINKVLRVISPTLGTIIKSLDESTKKAVKGSYDFSTDADTFVFVDADVNVAADTISESAHGLRTGDAVVLSTDGVLPTGLSAATAYYAIYVNASTFKLATTRANALSGTAINITAAAGGGNHTLKKNVFGQIPLGVSIPDNAIVTRTYYQVLTTFTDGDTDAATIGLQLQSAGDITTAVAISAEGDVWDGGSPVAGSQDNAIGNFLKLTAERALLMPVAVAPITAGKIDVFVEYVEGS